VHPLKELPEHSRVAYHFCKEVTGDLNQCVLNDGTGPDAKLLDVEYLVSDTVYQKMPAEAKAYCHDHKYDAGYLELRHEKPSAVLGHGRVLLDGQY
jgi:hypothetical protein